MQRVLLALLAILPAWAGRIDITYDTLVSLRTGAQLEITISTGVRPSGIGFQILGPALDGAAVSLMDGSTLPYYSGYLFEARLESLDRRVSVPVSRLVLTPGQASISGFERAVAVLDGFSRVPEGFFDDGENQALLRIVNLGPAVEFGLGSGYTVRNAISIPGLPGADGTERSGRVQSILLASPDEGSGRVAMRTAAQAETPEPETALLLAAALGGLAVFASLSRRKRRGVS
ncbi:MAG TPA: PEP-CTERM sorting domain-containing protein [Bryobacteraceae bacterium]|nr:PEP-CTERM sorting domain-containing protein [Bryobacteraceae bacterium]